MNSLQISTLNFSDTLWSLSLALKNYGLRPNSEDTLLRALHKVIYDNVSLACMYEDAEMPETFSNSIAYACEAYLDELVDIDQQSENNRSLTRHRKTTKLIRRMTRMVATFEKMIDAHYDQF